MVPLIRAPVAAVSSALFSLLLFAQHTRAQIAPVYIEPGHWAYGAIRALNTARIAPDASDLAYAPVTVQHARAVFDSANAAAVRTGRSDLAELAGSYARRIRLESDSASLVEALEVRAGWASASGEALAGDGYFRGEDFQGARPIVGENAPIIALRSHGHVRSWLSWNAAGGRLGNEWFVPAATLAVTAGPFDVWAGRRRLQFGAADGGAIVAGSGYGVRDVDYRTRDVFDGFGIATRDPFHFPAFLRFLGPARIEAELGRMDRNGRIDAPFIGFGRLMGSPFSRRITLGINRGAIFGGKGNEITAGRILGLIAGLHGGINGEFENQVFSTIIGYKPPLGPLAAELYVEWGMDDTAGAITDVPAQVFGFGTGPLPGAAAISAALEYTHFAQACCGNPPWYRSIFFRGSWADDGRIIAQPLGGHGDELLGRLRLDMPERSLFVRSEAFVRDRFEDNLFAVTREGRSWGGTINVEYQIAPGRGFRVDGAFERGQTGWNDKRFSIALFNELRAGRR